MFLKACSYSVAVANATEVVKKTATRVTNGAFGDGAVELVAQILIDRGAFEPIGRLAKCNRETRVRVGFYSAILHLD